MLTTPVNEVTRHGRPFITIESDLPSNMTIVDYRNAKRAAREVATAVAGNRTNRVLVCVTSWALFLLSLTRRRP